MRLDKIFETRVLNIWEYATDELLKILRNEFANAEWEYMDSYILPFYRIKFETPEDLVVFILKYGHIYDDVK